MRQPANTRQKSYAKRITKLASQDDEQNKLLFDIVDKINQITADEPFLKDKELKKKIIKHYVQDGHSDMEISRLYEAASHQVIPFFASGRKMSQADAILDSIAKKANDNLMQPVYNKDGQEVGTRFDASVAGVVVKAVKAKMDTLTKMQANVISAQSKQVQEKESNDFDIEDADREQLERLIAGNLIEHPEIVDKLLEAARPTQDAKMFYEVIDNE